MPIINYETLDAVPQDLREFAKDDNGKITVNVIPAVKLDSFRDNNIALVKERDALRDELGVIKPVFGDMTLEDFVKERDENRSIAQRVKDGELKEGRQIEEATAKRTEEMRKGFEGQVQAEAKEKVLWRQRHDEVLGRYKNSLVESYIKDACMDAASGVNPNAIDDIVTQGLRVFKCDDNGKITPTDGEATIYGSDGVTPMNPTEWLGKLKESKSHYFKGTNGGGAGEGSLTGKTVHGKTHKEMRDMKPADLLALANSGTRRT